ncbi:TetR/AcrR family transcriptional regulator [Streptomonospora nanhaiensis]|uniref:TetR/AcrR family transcriptional regulator n=1 Tax=Streptomonospora nanhaiensis TaxID=1323731 RepID=UPI001C38A307|nr:TetR/AcrR family transcriptional regulator [Streptomonospora nanhaiensis]MBV2363144.1 TetR/AcrR family transcriptional regulator [Streptomonospora nanhaiensis]
MPTPPAARPLTPAARRVLDTAHELFYTRGINSVGMDLLAERAGITKKTVYDRFGSKDALVVAYLAERDERWRAYLTGHLAGVGGGRERILATFDALGAWLAEHGTRGCAMVNACTELPDADHPGRRVAREQKEWTRGLYRDLAAEAGAADPDALAEALLILHEGATVAFTVLGAPEAARTARRAAEALLPQG